MIGLVDLQSIPNKSFSGNKFNHTNGKEKIKFTLSCVALYFLLTLNGHFQQFIFGVPGFRPFEWHLLFFQLLHCLIFGWLEMLLRRIQRSTTSLSVYGIFGSLVLCHYAFTTHAIVYLNHPVHVAFECGEMFALMAAGIYFLKKRYNLVECISTVFTCIGLVAFTLTNTHMAPEFHVLGVTIMCLAVSCDALLYTYQEKIITDNRVTAAEITFFTYLFGFVYLTTILVLSANFWEGISFCFQDNLLSSHIMVFCLTGYLISRFMLYFIKNYNALNTVIVITCYKTIPVVGSFLTSEQSFSLTFIWSGLLMIVGIYLNYYGQKLKSGGIKTRSTLIKNVLNYKSGTQIY